MQRLMPRSLQGQLLLAIALALLLAQGISAALLWRAQSERREAAMVHAAAIRLFAAGREEGLFGGRQFRQRDLPPEARRLRVERTAVSPLRPGESREREAEHELREVFADQGVELREVVVVHRPIGENPALIRREARIAARLGERAPARAREQMIAAIHTSEKGWITVAMPMRNGDAGLLVSLLGQTLLLYGLMVGAIALIVGRITRPLAALTGRLEQFASTRDAAGQLAPQGPDDVRRLIVAQNAMEDRIAALLDEKDVMLGAIGHDLKTPLTALRVRIESVEDETERGKMAATIEDIVRSLDDILSLARVGRPSDPREPAELKALVGQVADEFEDMGEPVSFTPGERIVAPVRVTWLRRGLRNLVSNALRYAGEARITLEREGAMAVIRVEDDGPGIPDDRIGAMMEPFTRGDPSRNSSTGGAGLGLTLARAIAEQHGGGLELANRRNPDGSIAGLTARLTLPLG
ncbi:ATP-binding protein [Novosphingobium sp.]|jgi:signal transduction histidine kinase|uniref:sensor histidine kinase n=1 Tax=Novosphingobium sp. TaxID=1874826 RepID=UPI001EB76607|nr:ATP-binding protein [Novosphingobium sp.]MBK6802660.1 two-component sensor histidine kinase [Novosphingobium sp.]MBK9012487.1 two-component sensor histidine kinase [Novosphingobium sp.]